MSGKQKNEGVRRRIVWLAMFLFTWMVVILWRLTWVQVVHHDYYAQQASNAQERKDSTLPSRGTIVDRNNRELAYSVILDSAYVDPVLFRKELPMIPVRDASGQRPAYRRMTVGEKLELAVRVLTPLLGSDAEGLAGKLSGDQKFLWLKRKLAPDVSRQLKDAIKENRLHGVGVREEAERAYPNQDLAAHLLGYLGQGETGVAGIEKRFDSYLQGKPGEVSTVRDGKGNVYERNDLPSMQGATIRLTIDSALQRKAEVLLAQAVSEHRARGASAIVMNPQTGEILALANAPTFDPNRIDDDVSRNPAYLNQAVMLPYEPGSIFKVITYAAAFNEGLISPEEMVDCGGGRISIGKRVIRDTHSYGSLTIEDAFAKSSNVAAIRVAQRLGKERFNDYITRFGFGALTNIELPGEERGLVHPPAKWRPDSIGSVAIGQEISVTLIQAVSAVAAIANKGIWVQPHLVSEIVPAGGGGPIYKAEPTSRQVVSEPAAQVMTRLLQRVVTHGTGRQTVQISGYTAAGKTGTPQKAYGANGYQPGKYMPSFLGFVPATEPRFAIVVMVDEPSAGSYYGGLVAAPIFSRLAEAALGGDDIVPDDPKYLQLVRELRQRATARPGETDAEFDPADGDEVADDASPVATEPPAGISYGLVPAPESSAGSLAVPMAPKAVTVSTRTDGAGRGDAGGGGEMPDLRGRGLRAVMRICADLGLNPKITGSGVAVAQSPPPGGVVRPGGECRVRLEQD